MWKVLVRGLTSHKLRLALTALAIVLGVGFVAGTFVLTDTINKTFSDLFEQTTKGTDVAVRTKETFGQGQRAPLPESVLADVQSVPGKDVAEGGVNGYAQFIDKQGKPVTTGGAPTLGISLNSDPRLRAGTGLREGAWPAGAGQGAMDAHTAKKYGFHVHDRVRILFQGAPGEFEVVAILGFGPADNLAGATLAAFDLPTAQRVLHREGFYDEIDVVAAKGVRPEELRDRIRARVGGSYEALTGKERAEDTVTSIGHFVWLINTALLAFAFVALFVGSFIIVNTFSIILAQRSRELALLRCIGASRRQVLGMVLGEAFVVGVLASVVGLGVGVAVAIGLKAVFAAIGAELPSTTLVIAPRTIVVGLAVGIVVTVLASLVPAIKATRVPPVAALREEAATTGAPRIRWRRVVFGTVVTLVGLALLLLGWPFARWAGQPGKLARDNAMRSPRRTASTAAALMIGLALVSFVTIFASSIKASTNKVLDESVAADYILTGPTNSGQGFSTEVARRLADQASGGVAIREDVAKQHGWKVGDTVPMAFPVGGTEPVPVKAIFKDNRINAPYLLSLTDYQRHYADQIDVIALVKVKSGVSADASRAAVDRVVAAFPNVSVKDQAQYKEDQSTQIDQLLTLFYLLLALAV